MSKVREALIEFAQVGNCVKVSAMDPRTLTEVSIVGPITASREQLTRTVVKKLHYVLARGRAFRSDDSVLVAPQQTAEPS